MIFLRQLDPRPLLRSVHSHQNSCSTCWQIQVELLLCLAPKPSWDSLAAVLDLLSGLQAR